ncbi:MAG: class I SAM-dependent RNA methyltransferase [Syntrophobacteraceae bacterium]
MNPLPGTMDPKSNPLKALQKRIKRHVQAREHRFVAIAPPELTSICLQEIKAIGAVDCSVSETGVEFSGSMETCYLANLWSRTASRVLCRVHRFRAGVLEELFHKVSHFPWELWIDPLIPLQVDAHVRFSRIEHEGWAQESVLKAIQRCFTTQGLVAPSPATPTPPESTRGSDPDSQTKQRILVHLVENHCEISLDTTGEHLHRRGYRLHHAGAPLRETLAAAILLRSGWKDDLPLVDGMCGAGTIPIEAALMARRIPPGINRSFLFERWPSFAAARWEYLRRKAREAIRERARTLIVGVDAKGEAIEIARNNARRASLSEDILWESLDFFDFEPSRHGLRPGVLILNPPYGKRLETAGREFYERLGLHARSRYRGWKLAVLAPQRSLLQQVGLPSLRIWQISHGGLLIFVGMGRV